MTQPELIEHLREIQKSTSGINAFVYNNVPASMNDSNKNYPLLLIFPGEEIQYRKENYTDFQDIRIVIFSTEFPTNNNFDGNIEVEVNKQNRELLENFIENIKTYTINDNVVFGILQNEIKYNYGSDFDGENAIIGTDSIITIRSYCK